MNYEVFARVYDTIMDETLYKKWEDFTTRHIPSLNGEVLELACGTGDLAIAFAKRGFNVTGLDLSLEMLTLADAKGFEAKAPVRWIKGDMRDLREIGTFDIVTCYSDSLCYLKDIPDVQQTFDEVYHVLKDKGTFLFDVHSTYQIEEGFKSFSFHDQEEEFAFLWDSYKGEAPFSVEHALTFFVQEKKDTAHFIRKDELHQERTYPIPQYLHLLENAGFLNVEVFADFKDEKPNKESKRWFFVCHKN